MPSLPASAKPFERGVDRLGRRAVDRRIGETAGLRAVEHLGVDLGRCDRHPVLLLRSSPPAFASIPYPALRGGRTRLPRRLPGWSTGRHGHSGDRRDRCSSAARWCGEALARGDERDGVQPGHARAATPDGVEQVVGDRTGRRPRAARRAALRPRRRHLRLRPSRGRSERRAARPDAAVTTASSRASTPTRAGRSTPTTPPAARTTATRTPPRDDIPAGLEDAAALRLAQGRLRARGAAGRSVSSAAPCCAPARSSGPHDGKVGRLPWWIDRVARGGEVLVPGAAVGAGGADRRARPRPVRASAGSPACSTPAARAAATPGRTSWPPVPGATGSDATFTYVDDALARRPGRRGVDGDPAVGLGAPRAPGVFAHRGAAAEAAGLAGARCARRSPTPGRGSVPCPAAGGPRE